MSKFLTTVGISYQLEEIIKNANERLILIRPFLKVNERVKALLQEKDHLKIDMRFIYGKKELPPSERGWIDSTSSIRFGFRQDLHAKCYLNENAALLTSMNLHESSQVNNYEMGLYISRAEDPDIYDSILNEAKYLLTNSDPPLNYTSTKSKPRNPTQQGPQRGFCIKCNKDIPFRLKDLEDQEKRPFCEECQKVWKNRSESEKPFDTPEEYCHAHGRKCPTHGEDHNSSYARPVCEDCYPEVGPR